VATYYAVNAGGNWNTGATWSTNSAKSAARTGDGATPTASDTCYLDDYSGSVTVNATTCVCLHIYCTTNGTYAGTLTFTASQKLTVSGNVEFNSTMGLTGTGNLTVSGTNVMTSGGCTFPGDLTFGNSGTRTLVGNWINTGLWSVNGGTTFNATTAETMTCNGGMTIAAGISGTVTLITLGGTGKTWSGTGAVNISLTINCTSLTIASSGVSFGTGTFTYTAGTITTTNSTLTFSATSCIFNSAGITWATVTGGTSTVALTSDLTCSTLIFPAGGSLVFSGANINCATLTLNNANGVRSHKLPSTFTTTVSTALNLIAGVQFLVTIASDTASSAADLVYNGALNVCKCAGVTFTDIDYSGGTVTNLDNWYGGTLTRTTGITNRTSTDIGGGTTSDIFGIT